MRRSMRFPLLACVIATCTLAACQAPSPSASEQAQPPATDTPQVTADTSKQPARTTDQPAPGEAASPVAPAAFVDKVWRVKSSSAVAPDTIYAFLSDGTLVVDSPGGTPMHGQWRFEGDKLTMIEEGQSYPTDILRLDASELHLRSHNPGEPVDIVLTLAPDAPLPKVK